MEQNSESLIYLILAICVVIFCLSILFAIYLTGKSQKVAKRDISVGLKEIDEVSAEAAARIQRLDCEIIDGLKSLSQPANEFFSLSKQLVELMLVRAERVRALSNSGKLEDLYSAHRIITSPLENVGDHLSSLVFASTVLELEPGEYRMAIASILDSVEGELRGGRMAEISFKVDNKGFRRRKFTIRGLLRQLQSRT